MPDQVRIADPLNRVVLGDDARTRLNPFICDIVFVDVETTGLSPEYHDVIEVGLVRAQQVNLEIVREYTLKVQVMHPDRINPVAVQVNGWTAEGWQDALPLNTVMGEVLSFMRGAALCAHNAPFDQGFLYHSFRRCGLIRPEEPTPWFNNFDTLSDSQLLLRQITPRLRGTIVAEALRLAPEPEPHNALSGARQCYQIYRRLRQIVDDPAMADLINQKIESFSTTS